MKKILSYALAGTLTLGSLGSTLVFAQTKTPAAPSRQQAPQASKIRGSIAWPKTKYQATATEPKAA